MITIDAGHEPVATRMTWLMPTAAVSRRNQLLTVAASRAVVSVTVPASGNRMRLVG